MSQKKNIHPKSRVIKIPKPIIYSGKILQFLSPSLAAKFASKLFRTPIKFKVPSRELHMVNNTLKKTLYIPAIKKNIVTYHYGDSTKTILLVHGWSGRGTQLVKIADALIAQDYKVLTFDAPAHGNSEGKTTMMNEFIDSIKALENEFGFFEAAIGHSLGGIALLNAVKDGLNIKKLVTIGAGNSITEICDLFINNMQLKPKISVLMKNKFDALFDDDIENYSSFKAAGDVKIPVLLIHDYDDDEIPIKVVDEICKELDNASTYITNELGHRKILGDENTIKRIVTFLS
jgi:pimeloyl-ACP methyl ester carboxylesterase